MDTSTVTPITVSHQGVVYWWNYAPMITVCKMVMTHFPFDKHDCNISLIPVGYTREELNLVPYTSSPSFEFFIINGEWDITAADFYSMPISVPTGQVVNMITSRLSFKRLPTYFIINLMLPTVALSFLSILVFVLPADSGEKVRHVDILTLYCNLPTVSNKDSHANVVFDVP